MNLKTACLALAGLLVVACAPRVPLDEDAARVVAEEAVRKFCRSHDPADCTDLGLKRVSKVGDGWGIDFEGSRYLYYVVIGAGGEAETFRMPLDD